MLSFPKINLTNISKFTVCNDVDNNVAYIMTKSQHFNAKKCEFKVILMSSDK